VGRYLARRPLTVPRSASSGNVLAGAYSAAMAFCPGHVSGTPLPGEREQRDRRAPDTHLAFLAKLKPGDILMPSAPMAGA